MARSRITIRLVYRPGQTNEDSLQIIKELDKKILNKYHPYAEEHLRHSYWWLAFADGKAVGFAGLDPNRGTNGFLSRCGVLSHYRGLGLQKRFLRVRERMARKIGLARTITHTYITNYASINSLTRAGYKIYKPKEFDRNWLFFRKEFHDS